MRHVQPLHDLAERFAAEVGGTFFDQLSPEWGGTDARVLIVLDSWHGAAKREAREDTRPGYFWQRPKDPTFHGTSNKFGEALTLADADPAAMSVWNSVPATITEVDQKLDVSVEVLAERYLARVMHEHRDLYAILSMGGPAHARVERVLNRYANPNGARHFRTLSYGRRAMSAPEAKAAGGQAEAIAARMREALSFAYPLGFDG